MLYHAVAVLLLGELGLAESLHVQHPTRGMRMATTGGPSFPAAVSSDVANPVNDVDTFNWNKQVRCVAKAYSVEDLAPLNVVLTAVIHVMR